MVGKAFSYIKRTALIITAFAVLFANAPLPVFAIPSNQQLNMFSHNDIMFYDPSSGQCIDGSVSSNGNSDGSDVYMIGDSITYISQSVIKEVLPKITINAQSSIWFSSNEPGLVSGVDRVKDMGDQPILVFALGTNGGINQEDIDKLFAALNGKDVKLILMTLYYQYNSETQMNNANTIVKATAEKYDNVSYMDWNAAVGANPTGYLADNVHPNAEGMKVFAETVKEAVNKVSQIGVESNLGDGNYAAVMSAKNADVNVPYVPYNSPPRSDGWHAYWSDGDEDSMASLLEKFGDLAYQLGRAVGAPYVAILVQMRYEDPNSACGDNNYWGNGCDPSHAYFGGANLTMPADSLGKGFSNYGKTLSSSWYEPVRGITDPTEYLEKIGPLWVQGDPNGPGYSSIASMRKSVKALQDFIDSPRGQDIVSQFGNYTGSYAGGTVCKTDLYAGDGVTTKVINGVTYAFPIAYATKENYLTNTKEHPSILSMPHGWYHHDYPATDLGIYYKMVTGKDFSPSDYTQWSSSTPFNVCGYTVEHCNSSTGAPVVATTDGVITYYEHYTNLSTNDSQICAAVSVQSSVGNKDRYIYLHLGWEDEFKNSVGKQVKVGDVIGHIGPTQCAQSTQAHVHFEIAGKKSPVQLIDELYNALPKDAAELAARGGTIGQSGLTYEQAKKFMMNYGENKNGSSSKATGAYLWNHAGTECLGNNSVSPSSGLGGSNCVTFSAFFLNKFTKTKYNSGNGSDVVRNLQTANKGSTPKVWSVFSWSNGSYGHTGVIMGYQNGEWIVGHAGCSRYGIGKGDGTNQGGGAGFVIKSSNLQTALWGNSNATYAYLEDQVDLSAISSYLNTGV